jgi:ATP-dependent DNA ligase
MLATLTFTVCDEGIGLLPIAQIGFTEWTNGYKLRHPRFLRLREDKRPEEVVRES